MKWVSKNVLVARPVVLYVRDVPILWLPFIFQDVRPGPALGHPDARSSASTTSSGRPRTYNRQVTNIGYYWAPNDYMDLTARLDWFANRYVQYGVTGQYRWLNRFMSGTVGVNEQRQVGGGIGTDASAGTTASSSVSSSSAQLQHQLREQHGGHPRQRDRSAAEHPADHQLAQLLQAALAGRR